MDDDRSPGALVLSVCFVFLNKSGYFCQNKKLRG